MFNLQEFQQLQFEFESFQKMIEEEARGVEFTFLQSLKWNLIFNAVSSDHGDYPTRIKLIAQPVYEILGDYEGFDLLKAFVNDLLD